MEKSKDLEERRLFREKHLRDWKSSGLSQSEYGRRHTRRPQGFSLCRLPAVHQRTPHGWDLWPCQPVQKVSHHQRGCGHRRNQEMQSILSHQAGREFHLPDRRGSPYFTWENGWDFGLKMPKFALEPMSS